MLAAVDGFVWDGGFVTAHFWSTRSKAEPAGQLMHFLVSKSKYWPVEQLIHCNPSKYGLSRGQAFLD